MSVIFGLWLRDKLKMYDIRRGVIPLLDLEQAKHAQPITLPWAIKHTRAIDKYYLTISTLLLLLIPILFYYLQRYAFLTSDTIFFDNIFSAILVFFPTIGLVQLLIYLIWRAWPGLWDSYVYHVIIDANDRYYWRKHHIRTPPRWEYVIEEAQIRKVAEYERKKHTRRMWLYMLVAPLLSGLLFLTYHGVTTTTWVESYLGIHKNVPLTEVKTVTIDMKLGKRFQKGKIEESAQLYVKLLFPGDSKGRDMCYPYCKFNYENAKQAIEHVHQYSNAQIHVAPIDEHVREFTATAEPQLLRIYNEISSLERR